MIVKKRYVIFGRAMKILAITLLVRYVLDHYQIISFQGHPEIKKYQ